MEKTINPHKIGVHQWAGSMLLVFSLLLMPQTSGTAQTLPKNQMLLELIKGNDAAIPRALKNQWTVENSLYYGAAFDADSVVNPIGTADLIQRLMCSYVSPSSEYFHSKEILHRMTLAAKGLLSLQHEDGTIDLISTNFHSTPDLGFTVYPLAMAYSILSQQQNPTNGELPGLMKQFLLQAGEALTIGGIHTPNHRWVVSGALAWIHRFFPNPKYRARVDQWLAEKIDIDPDGQYHERSTAVYTPITNRSLIDIARFMDYDYLYADIRKNLDMSFYFVRSTGEIVTESSNRQDKYRISNMSGYYLAYNYMSLLDKDSRYAGMVDYIEKTVPLADLTGILPYLLDDSSFLDPLPDPSPIPINYHKYFEYSDMARIRKDEVDMSIIANNSTFFTFFKGQAALEAVRLSASFFGKGQFQSQKIEKVGDTYILSATLYSPYYQPLPNEKIPLTGESWGQVPRTERAQSEIQELHTKIYITESGGKAKIKVSIDGPKNLPVTLELGFRMGGILSNVIEKQGISDAFLVKNGEYATYDFNGDTIKVGPGLVTHKWTQLRGALTKLPATSLYMTHYAPCEFEFIIE